MGDDLMGLAVVVVIAGGAFYLLTRDGNFGLGPANADAEPDPNDVPGTVTGGTGVSTATGRCKSLYNGSCCVECKQPTSSACTKCKSVCGASKANCASSTAKINCADGHSCGERCAKRWCTSYKGCCSAANHPGGCAACGVGGKGGSVTNCGDLCRRRECSSYYKLCGKTGCTECNWAHECAAGNCESGHTYDDTCKIGGKLCPPLGSARARAYQAYTGRVTFNQSAPTAFPNSIPMSTPKSASIPPQRSMFSRR